MKQIESKQAPSGFRITTVGTGKPGLDLTRGGASTLIEYQDKRFLVDCGFHSIATLLRIGIDPRAIPNMLFTHQHNDHNGDYLHFLIGGWGHPAGRRRLNLAGPGVQALHQFALDVNREDLDYRIHTVHFPAEGIYENVTIEELTQPTHQLELDGVQIQAAKLAHTITDYGYRFEAGGKSVVVTGDTMYCKALPALVADCDVLVIDAMLVEYESQLTGEALRRMRENLSHSHIMQEEIIDLLVATQPKDVILTHLGGIINLAAFQALCCAAGYKGTVWEAHDGAQYDVE